MVLGDPALIRLDSDTGSLNSSIDFRLALGSLGRTTGDGGALGGRGGEQGFDPGLVDEVQDTRKGAGQEDVEKDAEFVLAHCASPGAGMGRVGPRLTSGDRGS